MKLIEEDLNKEDNYVELSYDELPITVYGTQRDADDWDERDIEIGWTYKAPKDEVKETIYDLMSKDYPNLDGEDKEKYLEDNLDKLVDKYYTKLLDYFEDNAIEDAQENNDEEYNPGPDPDDYRYDENLNEDIEDNDLDAFIYSLNNNYESYYIVEIDDKVGFQKHKEKYFRDEEDAENYYNKLAENKKNDPDTYEDTTITLSKIELTKNTNLMKSTNWN